jgi:hypothetical protein
MMLELDNVLNEWKEDADLDKVLVDESALKIACLHQKYLLYLNRFKSQHRKLVKSKKEFPIMDRKNNPDYIQIEEYISLQLDGIDSCERIIYAINQMSYNLSTIVKWRAFLKGSDELV